jgi:hypothetical protein
VNSWIIKSQIEGYPYYAGDLRWENSLAGARRFATRIEAKQAATELRMRCIPSKVYLVGRGLGVRVPKAEMKALRKVVAAAAAVADSPPDPTGWALRVKLHNALAELRRSTQ